MTPPVSPIPPFNEEVEIAKITGFIAHTLQQAGKTTAMVAVSGGVDSALSAALAVKAIGKEQVRLLFMPGKTSNPVYGQNVQLLIQALGVDPRQLQVIPIGSIVQKAWRIIHHYVPNQAAPETGVANRSAGVKQLAAVNRLRLANLAARIRMLVLYDQVKKWDGLVMGTENFSEHLLGYFTRFGDEASDVEPIRHLYKTQVWQLARFLGVPDSILTQAPSADLWPGQTDAKELGFTYEAADPILYLCDQGKNEGEIVAAGYEPELVKAVLSRVHRNRFKHEAPYHL